MPQEPRREAEDPPVLLGRPAVRGPCFNQLPAEGLQDPPVLPGFFRASAPCPGEVPPILREQALRGEQLQTPGSPRGFVLRLQMHTHHPARQRSPGGGREAIRPGQEGDAQTR